MPRFESYRGFLFGSLNPDVPPLAEHLGESAKIIDLIVDQSPDGLEVLRGSSSYIYDGNWKLQTENGADGYHVSAVHWNYAATTSRRKTAVNVDTTRAMDAGGWAKQGGGFYSFENGHLLLWTRWSNPEDRPLYERRDELIAEYGQAKADWMIGISRNLCLYPNVYLMDQFGSQIRTYRPISVDKTEVTIYCIAPEERERRGARPAHPAVRGLLQRQRHGDPRRPGGIPLLPDRLHGQGGAMERHEPGCDPLGPGCGRERRGDRPSSPLMSGKRTEDEGLFVVQHQYWQETMRRALEAEAAEDKKS